MMATLRQRQTQWLSRRLPPARSIALTQRRLFIFPTRAGFLFLLSLMLMLLMAINYQSNLIYGLTFWLGTLFVVTIHFTHANLSGLQVIALGAEPCFSGKSAIFGIRLSGAGRARHTLRLQWQDVPRGEAHDVASPLASGGIEVAAGGHSHHSLSYPVTGRGWCAPGRIRIETEYPFGLLRCWSYLSLDQRVMVWPQPIPSTPMPVPSATDSHDGARDAPQSEQLDLAGHRDYREGDRASQIDWRTLARGQPLQVSVYQSDAADPVWLDWQMLSSTDPEQRLSQLCMLALSAHEQRRAFGLRLPDREVPIAAGRGHLEQVLNALALCDVGTPEMDS